MGSGAHDARMRSEWSRQAGSFSASGRGLDLAGLRPQDGDLAFDDRFPLLAGRR